MAKEEQTSRKQRTERKARKKRVEFKGYLNRNISNDEKETYLADVKAGFQWYDKVEELISDGYNLKWSWDDYNEAFAATLYNTNIDDPHGGYSLSFRGKEPFESMQRLMWVHYVLLAGTWDNISVPREDDEW